MRGYLDIVTVALRGTTGLYVRRDSDDRVNSSLSGSRVQGTGRGTRRGRGGGRQRGRRREIGGLECDRCSA